MDQATFIRVKLEFRKYVKVTKLDARVDTALSSMMNLRKLVYKNFPEVGETVQASGTSGAATMLLSVKCADSTGNLVTLETDEDLEVAVESSKKSEDLSFEIDMISRRSFLAGVPTPADSTFVRPRVQGSGITSSSRTYPAVTEDYGAKQQNLCRGFASGHCRNGQTCRFSHDPTKKMLAASFSSGQGRGLVTEILFRNVREVDDWLMKQLRLASGENIEQLSSEKGHRVLAHVVEWKNLPSETISLVVKLFARDEIRLSLLRQNTNKIYGILLGSPVFLEQLHAHVANHLGLHPTRAPKAQDLRPYLLLTEQLQSRTADGWKEVPLDGLQTMILKLEENPGKDELVAIVTRLVDQREELQRLLATAPPDKCFKGAKFRRLPIIPTKEEVFRSQDLPINRIGMQYSRVSDYLETHFQLLRADCTEFIRKGVQAYRCSLKDTNSKAIPSDNTPQPELFVYTGMQLFAVRCGDEGVEYVFSFDPPPGENNADHRWEVSKKLSFGSPLCVSSDNFQTFFWAVLARREVKDLLKGLVTLRIMGESDANVTAGLESGQTATQTYVMVESKTATFVTSYHVLKSLQREEMEYIPFTKYLLRLEPKVSPPSYLLRRRNGDEYDFSCVFPDLDQKLGRTSVRITQSRWSKDWTESLDTAQQDALKQGLTKELAIIQGPPGTGKTFLGLILVKILLANLKRNPDHGFDRSGRWRAGRNLPVGGEITFDISGPIVIICHTNHALDQFLEGIYRNGETNLIRIGRNSKSDLLKDKNIKRLVLKQFKDQKVEGRHHRFLTQGRQAKHALQSSIHKCIDAMGTGCLTYTMLDGVATREQIESLFSINFTGDGLSEEIIERWLKEEWVADHHLATAGGEAVKPLRGRMKSLQNLSVVDPDGGGILEPTSKTCQNVGWVQDNSLGNTGNILDNGPINEEFHLPDFVDTPDVWQLNLLQRRKLHEYWLEEIRMNQRNKLKELTKEYEQACRNVREVESEIELFLLRKANVVGITTSSVAAKNHDVLKSLNPEIIVVQEAAEVLEGHILACLSTSVKHLILIGDHLQLRPFFEVNRLSAEHNSGVSMFERLVKSGVEHVTLEEQRRMRPNISKLVRSIYPRSRDHESVTHYEAVKGVKSNLFFVDHKSEEDYGRDAASKFNLTEAQLVVELCQYLMNQGYKSEDIAILSMYTGQLGQIKTLLSERSKSKWSRRTLTRESTQNPREEPDLPRVSSVDDYQGEESDIVILSLVRSNAIVTSEGVGKIGFLMNPNGICVALTRARKGLFIFGNADLLAEKSKLWNEVTTSMRNDGQLGPELELYCQNHPDTTTRISTAEDFKLVKDGGCSLPCDYQLECGHACPRRCHPGHHDLVVCPKPCLRQYDEFPHICNLRCHALEECPPCGVFVTKQIPDCQHEQEVKCSTDVRDEDCRSECPKVLECSHKCKMFCGRPCTQLCAEKVVKMLPCGHSARVSCYRVPATYPCDEQCGGREKS